MGLGKKIMNAGLSAGSATLAGAGKLSEAVGKASVGAGESIIRRAMANPYNTALAVGGAAAVGSMLADADNSPNPSATAFKYGTVAAAATVIPGATSAMGAMSAGVAGAGVLGARGIASIGEKMIKVPGEAVTFSNMKDLKFTKLGKGMMVGGALIEGSRKAAAQFHRSRMGQHDGMVHKLTPDMPQNDPSYANNGGATGDLVFSLYNNR